MAGVSSGAVCAAVMMYLERSSSRAEVRRRAQTLYTRLEEELRTLVRTPASFIGRLGSVIERLLADFVAEKGEAATEKAGDELERSLRSGDRFRIGLRRWRAFPVPHACPEAICHFEGTADFCEH